MTHRMPGETLAISDSVAMMPTVQPAAAGTHEYREARRVNVAVIGREDIRSNLAMVVTAPATRPARCTFRRAPGPVCRARHWIHGTPTAVSSARRAQVRRADRG